MNNYLNLLVYNVFIFVLVIIVFGLLKWFGISAGSIVDWSIGIGIFWWLVIIVTVPWNIYFEAQEVITEIAISQEQGITVKLNQLKTVKKIARWSIFVAIFLHIFSALGLYLLAAKGISVIGYIGSGATLLLTGLRPALRFYQYLAERLSMIRKEIKYPREDIQELRNRVLVIENSLQSLEEKLDLNKPESWANILENRHQKIRQDLANLQGNIEHFQAKNQLDHQELSRESERAIAKLTEDSQFLSHVREIIRFFKNVD